MDPTTTVHSENIQASSLYFAALCLKYLILIFYFDRVKTVLENVCKKRKYPVDQSIQNLYYDA